MYSPVAGKRLPTGEADDIDMSVCRTPRKSTLNTVLPHCKLILSFAYQITCVGYLPQSINGHKVFLAEFDCLLASTLPRHGGRYTVD